MEHGKPSATSGDAGLELVGKIFAVLGVQKAQERGQLPPGRVDYGEVVTRNVRWYEPWDESDVEMPPADQGSAPTKLTEHDVGSGV